MSLRPRSVRTQVTLLGILLVGAIILVGASGVLLFQRSMTTATSLTLGLTPAHDANIEVLTDLRISGAAAADPAAVRSVRPDPQRCGEAADALARVDLLYRDPDLDRLTSRQSQALTAWCEPVSWADPAATLTELAAANAAVTEWIDDRREHARAELRWLRSAGLVGLSLATLVVAALATLGAAYTVRMVSAPLTRLVAVLDRLRGGDTGARAQLDGSAEVRRVSRAVNAFADQSDAARAEADHRHRLRTGTLAARARLSEQLLRQDILDEAAASLGDLLEARAVWIRELDATGVGPVRAHWVGGELVPVPDPPDELRGLLRATGWGATGETAATVQVDPGPDAWRAELVAAGIGRVLEVAAVGPDRVMAGITVGYADADRGVTVPELSASEDVARALAVGLSQSELFETQSHLVDSLQELDRQKSTFVSTVSHELRTPLASMLGYTESVLDGDGGELPPRAVQMIDAVDRNAKRLHALIDDLLTLATVEAAQVSRRPVSLAPLLAGVVEQIRPLAVKGGLVLTGPPAPPDVRVSADPHQLERAVLNLLSNAVKFTPAGGEVRLTLATEPAGNREAAAGPAEAGQRQPGRARIMVSDNGIGIDERDQPELFTRFYRASNAVEASIQGTGLGLGIVRDIVEDLGGEVSLASRLGEGTTVTVLLPLTL